MTADLTGLRVLVVEDDYLIASDIAGALKQRGAIVVGPIGKLPRALELSQSEIDVAVLDINLAGQIGYAVADALIARNIPYVFATGYDSSTIPSNYAHAPYFEKPLNHRRMAEALIAACRTGR
jgi:CheY-like chemotaxis protein